MAVNRYSIRDRFVRIFVSEFVCGGGCDDRRLHASLKRDGLAMLTAACADFARLSGCRVVTTLDARLADGAREQTNWRSCRDAVDVIVAANANEGLRLFRQQAAECDRTFVIAPETGGILADRRRAVDAAGGTFLGPSPAAIELCADKLRLAEHFRRRDIPTIETRLLPAGTLDSELRFPAVVKRRDGAGSLSTSLVRDRAQLQRVWRSHRKECRTDPEVRSTSREEPGELVVQPLVRGRDLSVAAIVSEDAEQTVLLPVAAQRLSRDGQFQYLGGRIPAANVPHDTIRKLIRRACASVAGLSGYVGFDFLLPDASPTFPVVVEINPRLTTSYLGYRALTSDNIAERLLFPERKFPPLRWKRGPVNFSPGGEVATERRFGGKRSAAQ